jgi:uncharacterized protein (DUF1501 family)
MKRRDFLKAGSFFVGGSLLLPLGRHAWAATGASQSPTGQNPKRLIVIFQRGAVDGLSVVVPHGDSDYYGARSNIAIPRKGDGGVIDLDGHFGLHPSLAAVQPLWQEKSLAFIHASGSPDPSRSHFDAQAMMETGTPGNPAARVGWLNRLLSELPGVHAPTEAISLGPTTPRILSGPIGVANIDVGKNAGKPTALDRPAVNQAFGKLYDGDDDMSRAYRDGRASHQQIMSDMEREMQEADNGAPSANGFPAQAKRLAALIQRDSSVRVAFVALGGWDTHVNQGNSKGQLANHLQPLAEGLATLRKDLGPVYNDTVILVISEFGRTVHENGNGGTDHGHGNVMWVMGGPINGGKVYGEWPGLSTSRLYQQRDLAITTDFRTGIGTVVERHMGFSDKNLQAIFPDMPQAQSGAAGILKT